MRRIAIDFGTTGVRRAIADAGRITIERADGVEPLAQLNQWLADSDGDVTLCCTHPQFRSHPRAFWNELAVSAGSRWFRVAGDQVEESVALGVARQFALLHRTPSFVTIDVGHSQAAVAIACGRGRLSAIDRWTHGGDAKALPSTAVERIGRLLAESKEGCTDGPMPLFGIGGYGPLVARQVVGELANMVLVERPDARELSTIGILLANIVRTFESPLLPEVDDRQIASSLSVLMDEAFEAITREGYDLDDAECIREVVMARRDHRGERAVTVGMDIDTKRLRQAYDDLESPASGGSNPVECRAARVTAIIEPMKPTVDLFHRFHR